MNAADAWDVVTEEIDCLLRYRWARIRFARGSMLNARAKLKATQMESGAPPEAHQYAQDRFAETSRNLAAARWLAREDLAECLSMLEGKR